VSEIMVQSLDDIRRRRTSGSGGRVPPHNLQAEESLLGAMLLSRDAIAAAVETCGADDFYKPAHGHVFDAACSLYGHGEPVDPVTVADELRRADLLEAIGGPATLISLQANTPATANAARYARIVEEHALLRRLIGVAGEIAEMGYSLPEDISAAIDRAESMVFEVAERRVTDSLKPLHDLLAESLDRLEALYDRGESITGVPTGYLDLDERLSGLQPSSLVIVGARPSMGKTALALGMAAHAAMEGRVPVLYFSLEMSHSELTQRLLCSEARVDSSRIRNGKLLESDWPKISHAIGRLGEAPLYIDDNPNLTIMEVRAKARRLKSRLGELGLVVIDYLQLMSGRNHAENRQVEVSEISRGLKILARELECPVLALSQLSRGLEMRQDKRPMLADLRESGCLTADTRITRADNGRQVTMGELLASGEEHVPVWTLNENYRLVRGEMTKVFPSGIKTVHQLTLSSGRSVKASANHPFLALEGWFPLEKLDVGDCIAVPRSGPWPESVGADEIDGDTVPRELWSYIRKCLPHHGLTLADVEAGLQVDNFVETFYANPLTRAQIGALAQVVPDPLLVDLARSDVRWDTIVSITELGDEEVYDATVPGTHNFVAEGIVAHNSIEQDADVVMFIYRDEVYNRDSPDKGTAELIVGKQRNGPIGDCRMAFMSNYTRFADMADTRLTP
jgi:replicative DNA helicase